MSVWLFCPLFQLLRFSELLSRCVLAKTFGVALMPVRLGPKADQFFKKCNNASSLQFCWS